MIDTLIQAIIKKQNPSVIGLDTSLSYLPDKVKATCDTMEKATDAILQFNKDVIDSTYDVVPAVKVQIAYYEQYGTAGLKAFYDTVSYAKEHGLIVIGDCKRNDIGSTASCYATAYLGKTPLEGGEASAFPVDFLTVNGYLGEDGVLPFINECKKSDKGIFVLVKTSNPSSGQLQDLMLTNGKAVYEEMGELVARWNEDSVTAEYGYGDVGAVVGATHKAQAENLRKRLPNVFFLIPGYGAQGGSARDLAVCFDKRGLGGIVNSSRGIICAYKAHNYRGMDVGTAARAAVFDMRSDILQAIFSLRGCNKIGG